MEFKSRIVRSLPVIALMASLIVPFKPVAAAERPYTAAVPGLSAAPAAQITAGDPTADSDELQAAGRIAKPRHKRHQLTVASDELDAAGRITKPRHKKHLLTVASEELNAAKGRRKPRHV